MKKLILAVVIILLFIISGFSVWGLTPQGPMPEIAPYLKNGRAVTVDNSQWLTFIPKTDQASTIGFILYPGGHVSYRSYAPIAYKLAEKGVMVVIVPMPLSLAVLNPGAADEVMQAYPEIQKWLIGGHSLGGAMAANYAYEHPTRVHGLVLWGAYPAKSNDLSKFRLPVISIYGSLDGMATGERLAQTKPLLPLNTQYMEIIGGNHAQMGWYGNQAGDSDATISRDEQQSILLDATWNFIRGLD